MRRTSSQCALLFAHDISTQAVAWRRKCDRRRLLGLLRLRWLASSFCELSERHWPPLKKLGRHKLPWSTFADASSHAALGEAQSIQGSSGEAQSSHLQHCLPSPLPPPSHANVHYNTTEVSDVSSDHFCHSAPAGEAEPRSHRRLKKRFGIRGETMHDIVSSCGWVSIGLSAAHFLSEPLPGSQTSGSEGVNNAFNQLRLSSSVSSHSDVPITILERIGRRKVGNFSGAEARRFPLEKACAL